MSNGSLTSDLSPKENAQRPPNDLSKDKLGKEISDGAKPESSSEWEKIIPWFLTAACTVSLISIALFLILNVQWFKASVFDQAHITNSYKIYVYHMHLSMVKRSVGLFSGFAMMFVGASVCFYIVKAKTDLGFKSQSFSLNLMTTSPGIIAMVLGASLIMFTIWSKDDFPGPDATDTPQLIQPGPEPSATQKSDKPDAASVPASPADKEQK